MWIYVLGERNGRDIMIGRTDAPTVNDAHMVENDYVLLASVLGSPEAQRFVHNSFAAARRFADDAYFLPTRELIEWIVWLRQQWWTCFDPNTPQAAWQEPHASQWVPDPTRRSAPPEPDPDVLVQTYEQLSGPLAGSFWSFLPDPLASFQDYFTPPELVACARTAMGSIDLDAASHWIANRRLHEAGVEVSDYFTVDRSAFDHDWVGNVWLNPPYGSNERWFERARLMMDSGKLTQLCMLSPIYVFTTGIAAEMLNRAKAAVLLTPTPKFFNPGEPSKTGTNHPHAIFYWGPRRQEFLSAYAGTGIPIEVAWQPQEVAA